MTKIPEINAMVIISIPELLELEKYMHRQEIMIAAQIDIGSISTTICRRVLNAAVDALKAMKDEEAQ